MTWMVKHLKSRDVYFCSIESTGIVGSTCQLCAFIFETRRAAHQVADLLGGRVVKLVPKAKPPQATSDGDAK